MELTRVCSPVITPNPEDFQLYRGITLRSEYKFTDDSGDPISIEDAEITLFIVTEEGEEILTISSISPTDNGSEIIVTDETDGIVEILITNIETSQLTFEEARWWLTLKLTNGDILLKGQGSMYLKEPYK